MPFPLRVGVSAIANGPQLIDAIVRDTAAGGGTLVPNKNAAEWVMDLIGRGSLTGSELTALVAALIQKGQAETVSVGLRLAERHEAEELGPLLLSALGGLDIGTLLMLDPLDDTQSIEDQLLRCTAHLANLSDPTVRDQLLIRLRNAGHNELELAVISRFGTPDEVRIWLPAILAERLPTDWLAQVNALTAKGNDHAKAVEDALTELPADRLSEVREQLAATEVAKRG